MSRSMSLNNGNSMTVGSSANYQIIENRGNEGNILLRQAVTYIYIRYVVVCTYYVVAFTYDDYSGHTEATIGAIKVGDWGNSNLHVSSGYH